GTIVFDCDSTLSAIEGIDELAGEHKAAVAELTRRAMAGEIALEEIYGRRLELIRPDRGALDRVAELYARHALPGIADLVRELRGLAKRVVVVSGGLLPAVAPFAAGIGIGAGDVVAVGVDFDARGGYAGFDQGSPLARSGGKTE